MSVGRHIIYAAAIAIITGCAVQPEKAAVTIPFDPTTKGTPTHRIDTKQSTARIYIYRAGLMSKLGHNHIVLAPNLSGELWQQAATKNSAFHLLLPVNSLIVDPADLRAQAGADFASQPTAADIEGTRKNMLGEKILNAAQYPNIEIWSERIRGSGTALSADIVISAGGNLNRITIPLEIKTENENITASGKFTLKQTDIGIEPFSILMGAIAIRDELEIEYTITARPKH